MSDTVVCALAPGPSIPGGVIRPCTECGKDCLLSPQGMAFIAESPNDRVIVCIPCAMAAGAVPDRAVPGAMEAAAKYIRNQAWRN